MVRVRPNIGRIRSAGRIKGVAGFINKRFAAEAAAAEAAEKRAHEMSLLDKRLNQERDESKKDRTHKAILKKAEMGLTARKNLMTQLTKLAEDPKNSFKEIMQIAVASGVPLGLHNLGSLRMLNNSAKATNVTTGLEKLSKVTSVTHPDQNKMFKRWVNENTYKNPEVIQGLNNYFGITVGKNDGWEKVEGMLKNKQIALYRRSVNKNLTEQFGPDYLTTTKPLSSMFPRIRLNNRKGILSSYKGKEKEFATVAETNSMIANQFQTLNTTMTETPAFMNKYKTDKGFRNKIHSSLAGFLRTVETIYEENKTENSNTVRIHNNLEAIMKRYMPDLIKENKDTISEIKAIASKSKIDPEINASRTADGAIEYYNGNPDMADEDSPTERISIRPKILSEAKNRLGEQVFNIDGSLKPIYRFTNADLTQQSTNPKIEQSKELTRLVDSYYQNREFDKGGDDTGASAAIFNYMETNFPEEIPADLRIEVLTNSIALRLPKFKEEQTPTGSQTVENDDLPEDLTIRPEDKEKIQRQLSSYVDLDEDLKGMITLSSSLEGVTGISADFSMKIVGGLAEFQGLVAEAKKLLSGNANISLNFIDTLWGNIDTSAKTSTGEQSFNPNNITRFKMSKEAFKTNMRKLRTAEQKELRGAANEDQRMSVLQKYRLQKLFEFKKVALTYRLSGMLQGDGLGGGRTISNNDFEVAMKALWGPQKGIKLRLEDFQRNIFAKIKTKRYQLQEKNRKIARIGVAVSDKYRSWNNKTTLDKEIFNRKNGDVKSYNPGRDSVMAFKEALFNSQDPRNFSKIKKQFIDPFERLSNNALVKKYSTLGALKASVTTENIQTGAMIVDPNTKEAQFLQSMFKIADGISKNYVIYMSKEYLQKLEKETQHKKVMKLLKKNTVDSFNEAYGVFFPSAKPNAFISTRISVANALFEEMKQKAGQ